MIVDLNEERHEFFIEEPSFENNVLSHRRLEMRTLMLFVVLLAGFSVVAEQVQSNALQRAVVETAFSNFGGVGHNETSDLESSNIVLADVTAGGNSDVMAQVASKFHGSTIAEELIQSYGAKTTGAGTSG